MPADGVALLVIVTVAKPTVSTSEHLKEFLNQAIMRKRELNVNSFTKYILVKRVDLNKLSAIVPKYLTTMTEQLLNYAKVFEAFDMDMKLIDVENKL